MLLSTLTVTVLLLLARSVCPSDGSSVLPAGEVYVGTGSSTVLTCSTDREQGIVWMKGDLGSQVAVGDLNDPSISSANNTLTIADFNYSSHGGLYSCSVEGAFDHRQLSCPTRVQHARITANSTSQRITRPVQVIENETAVFMCDVPPSWPPAQFHWERDGESMRPEADSRQWLMPSGNLYIVGVTGQDEGLYTCSTVNPVTLATRHSHVSYQLTVSELPPNSTSPPTFTVTPLNTMANVGSRAFIECLGHAQPTPILEWIIIHDTRFPREGSVLPTGTLLFDPVVPEDAGTYRCRLSNSIGADNIEITLEVREPPVFLSAPSPHLELPHTTNSTLLTCSATGTVPLELFLVHDGQVLASSTVTDTSGNGGSLQHDVTEEGFYQCFARNDAGCDQWTTFAVKGSPSTTSGSTTEATTVTEKPFSTTNGYPMATDDGPPTTEVDANVTTMTMNQSSSSDTTEPLTTAPLTTAPLTTAPLTTELYTRTTNYTPSTTEQSPPTSAPPTATPPHLFEILTSGDMFAVRVGDQLTFECHVVGGGEGTHLSWFFNSKPLSGFKVMEVEDVNGRSRLESQLSFEFVNMSHAGEYTCMAHSPLLEQSITAPITLIVSPILLPPLNTTVRATPQGGLLVTWLPNPLNPEDVIGYKLNWDLPSRIVQTALVGVPGSVKEFLITGVDLSFGYVVEVWAYTIHGDGVPATVRWIPKATVTTTMATVSMTATPPPVCVVMETSPTVVALEWPEEVGVANITASCQESQTSAIVPVTKATNSIRLSNLLPACRYEINVGVATCFVDTPPGPVDLDERVHRYDNGSLRLDWRLPRELHNDDKLTIDVRVNNGDWVTVRRHDNTPHLQTHFADGTAQKVEFRFSLREWTGFAVILVPGGEPSSPSEVYPTTSEEGGGASSQLLSEVGVVYGVIFGLLVVACVSVVVIILALKYVQMSRRDDDKVTTDRETQREEFRRLSLSRSSLKSVKKEPTHFYQPTQTDV